MTAGGKHVANSPTIALFAASDEFNDERTTSAKSIKQSWKLHSELARHHSAHQHTMFRVNALAASFRALAVRPVASSSRLVLPALPAKPAAFSTSAPLGLTANQR